MTDKEQKMIFAKNLNYFIANSGKRQIDVCNDLGIKKTTLNNWCIGKSIPKMSGIQKLADYFGIGKSDLVDDKLYNADASFDARFLNDAEAKEIISKYYNLSADKQAMARNYIDFLFNENQK